MIERNLKWTSFEKDENVEISQEILDRLSIVHKDISSAYIRCYYVEISIVEKHPK